MARSSLLERVRRLRTVLRVASARPENIDSLRIGEELIACGWVDVQGSSRGAPPIVTVDASDALARSDAFVRMTQAFEKGASPSQHRPFLQKLPPCFGECAALASHPRQPHARRRCCLSPRNSRAPSSSARGTRAWLPHAVSTCPRVSSRRRRAAQRFQRRSDWLPSQSAAARRPRAHPQAHPARRARRRDRRPRWMAISARCLDRSPAAMLGYAARVPAEPQTPLVCTNDR